ncbi:MAG: urease accessory protein UreE [Verrucomicrobiaceae bacterium]|nr:MAG: urease accessory protein UreE [Verrucomicrobiaceae bacterium]
MQLIHDHLHNVDPTLPKVPVAVDRLTLAKRRWRGVAADGREFGFDLEYPLAHGDIVFADGSRYTIAQKPESVLEVALATDPAAAARLGWLIGNLHFQLEVAHGVIRVADDPALRQLFEREHIAYTVETRVFQPLGGGHSHSHEHHHHH